MTKDRNKGITEITYNHLNLPVKITFESGDYIDYAYNAAGEKVSKKVRAGNTQKTVEYLDGFQYAGEVLQFIFHAEGYVNVTTADNGDQYFNYVYNHTDHLGNIRVTYTKNPQTGTLEIMEENHYYPFGLKHEVYSSLTPKGFIADEEIEGGTLLVHLREDEFKYKYNGKEWQDELGLNFYDYGARNYDPAIGRWMNIDPLSHRYSSLTPYNYAANNPIYFIDIDGMKIINGDKERKQEVDEEIERRTKELDNKKAKHGEISTRKEFIAKYGKKEGKATYKGMKKFEKALKGLKSESKELGKQIANTEAKIKELKKNAPNMFNKLDNLTNEYGETVDVYFHSSNYLGSNDGKTEMGFEFNEEGSQIRPISNFGVNTIQTTIINSPSGDRTTLEVIKHELGHVDYQAENTEAYYNYLKENNLIETKHGGHTPGDPSGARADEYQNLNDLP